MTGVSKIGGGFPAAAIGLVTSLSSARSSIPKPPDPPALAETLKWIASGQDWLARMTALFAGIAAGWSSWQMFQPSPAIADDVRRDGRRTRSGLEHVSKQAEAEGRASEQRDRPTRESLAKVLALLKAQGGAGAQQLETAAEAVVALSASPEAGDRAIAQQVIRGDPAEAFRALVAEAEADKLRTAEHFRQAARIIAPFSPAKARDGYGEAVALDPGDVWSWIELGRLRIVYCSLVSARGCFRAALQRVRNERDRTDLHNEFGAVVMVEGRLQDAQAEVSLAFAIAARRATQGPVDAAVQRDLFQARQ